ncbi:MAG: hypothetical protein ABH824_01390 [Nanoarchaeota archaeon]|nr:hypothetical protein [Nanoarchaeota archaeon]
MNKIIAILLGIFGFASISFFLMWGALHLMGEHETAEEVKKLPNTVNEIKENVTAETANVFTGAMVDLNEERKQAVENEKDPYLKMVINLIFLTVIIQFGIAILVLFGIKVK